MYTILTTVSIDDYTKKFILRHFNSIEEAYDSLINWKEEDDKNLLPESNKKDLLLVDKVTNNNYVEKSIYRSGKLLTITIHHSAPILSNKIEYLDLSLKKSEIVTFKDEYEVGDCIAIIEEADNRDWKELSQSIIDSIINGSIKHLYPLDLYGCSNFENCFVYIGDDETLELDEVFEKLQGSNDSDLPKYLGFADPDDKVIFIIRINNFK